MVRLLVLLAALVSTQQPPPPLVFPSPADQPEAVDDRQDFPYLPPLDGARLTRTVRVNGALELKSATADEEAVLAGMAYTQKSFLTFFSAS